LSASPFRAVSDGVCVAVRLTPKAARDRIQGIAHEADGAALLKVAVTAAPEHGKANAALLECLAETWRVPKTSLSLIGGANNRRKLFHLRGEPQAILARLTHWLEDDHADG